MKLSIIIPVYNEKGTILELLNRINNVELEDIKKQIIIVDDGSVDGTKEILETFKKDYRIIFLGKNNGKGNAIRTALKEVTGDIIIIQDADLEYNPKEYPKLIKPIVDGETSVVYGSRFLDKKSKKLSLYYFGNKFLTFMTNLLFGTRLTDMETCYKVVKSEIIKKIPFVSNRFEIEPEITTKLIKNGYKILEVPIDYNYRDLSQGKKIRLSDGFIALYTLLRYRFLR